MCVLSIKKDKLVNPLRAKYCIVVLGNHKDRVWTKSEKYAPVLRSDSLRLMVSLTVKKRRTLKQGDCKNVFCQGVLPNNEITIIKPPIGDPDAAKDEYWLLKKMLYGLRRSPHHWYNKITMVLQSIRLKPNASDPCMFTGSICNPNNTAEDIPAAPLTIGLYVDDFVYFSEDPEVEQWFEQLLSSLVAVNFWEPSIDSWAHTSNGHVTTTKYRFISVKPASRLTLLKTTTSMRRILLPMPLPIVRGSPLMRALNRMRPMTALHSSNAIRDTKVWSV